MQTNYYSPEVLDQFINNLNHDEVNDNIKKLNQRNVSREVYREFKLQEEIIQEQYLQSHLYQEKILNTYRQLQNLKNVEQVSEFLINQFQEDYLVIQNTAEQCLEWYYRTDNIQYLQVTKYIINKDNEFLEATEKKISKDIKCNQLKVYICIKQLNQTLHTQFKEQIYIHLLLNYSFCYLYDFKNADYIMKAINNIIDQENHLLQSQLIQFVYEQNQIVSEKIFQLNEEQLYNELQYTKQYITPKLQFNQDLENRKENLFIINNQFNQEQNLKLEITQLIELILQNQFIEQFLFIILQNIPTYAEFIINLYLDKIIKKNSIKYLNLLQNLITSSELKQLTYQNNKKKSLMRETLNIVIQQRFQQSITEQIEIQQLMIVIVELYKIGLISKPQIIIYIKQLLKILIIQILESNQSNKEIINSLDMLLNKIEINTKAKDHELEHIQNVLNNSFQTKIINWFDIEGLISFESLKFTLNVIKNKL